MLNGVYRIRDLKNETGVNGTIKSESVDCLSNITIIPRTVEIQKTNLFSFWLPKVCIQGYDVVVSGHFGTYFENLEYGNNQSQILSFTAENVHDEVNTVKLIDFKLTNPYDMHMSNDIEEVMDKEVTLYVKDIEIE